MIAMTTELKLIKRDLAETFGRMRQIESRALASILTLREAPKPLTMAGVLEDIRRWQRPEDVE